MTRNAELAPLLKRLKLGPMLDTLPQRIALARREQLDYSSFLEVILTDEVSRRENRRIELRLRAAGFEETCHLEDFLPRFNSRFKVPAQESEAAYRPVDDGIHLEKVLCFKYRRRVARDNTVRYRRRTLQLLPGTDRTSYAGTVVDVPESLDGHLEVQYQGRDIPSREAPPEQRQSFLPACCLIGECYRERPIASRQCYRNRTVASQWCYQD